MTGFFHKLKSMARGTDARRNAPFASLKSTQKWLQELTAASDYDLHHAIVEGLELYNGDIRGEALTRVEVLRAIEEAGLPLQSHLVAEFLSSHAVGAHAKHSLWRECHLFWDQLAVAYLPFLRDALNDGEGGKLFPSATEIAVKSLRYCSWSMRWEYLRGRRPGDALWRRLHKIYRMVEVAGLAEGEIEIEGRKTSCAREYVMTLLFDLASPYAFEPAEIQPVLEMLDGVEQLPVPESSLRLGRHTHMVDLSANVGPESIEERWVPGGRLRYLDFGGVVRGLEQRSERDKRYGALCMKLSKVIGRAGTSRRGPRKPRSGEVRAVLGADEAMKTLDPGRKIMPRMEFIHLRDESAKGLGFVLDEECNLAPGNLMAIERDEGRGSWQLLAVRWVAQEGYQWLLGTEILSKYPKQVAIEWQGETSAKETATAIFLPLASASQGATSNLLLPSSGYSAGRIIVLKQDDGITYRLKLGEIVEQHESWLRTRFDVLSREVAQTGQ